MIECFSQAVPNLFETLNVERSSRLFTLDRLRLVSWNHLWRLLFSRLSSPKQLLNAADGVALLVEEPIDPLGKLHVRWPIISPIAGALQRLQLRKLRFPIAQDVLGDPGLNREFANRLESARGFLDGCHCRYFAILSRRIWLARNVITRRGAIGTSIPVFGLRPIR